MRLRDEAMQAVLATPRGGSVDRPMSEAVHKMFRRGVVAQRVCRGGVCQIGATARGRSAGRARGSWRPTANVASNYCEKLQ